MTKDVERDPRLAEQFQALDTVPIPTDLAPRLRAAVLPARPRSRPLVAAAAALVLAAAGFLIGRISSPPTVVSRAPATASAVTPFSLLGTTRDGNVVSVRIAGSGLDPSSFSQARLRSSDGLDLAPEGLVVNGDGSTTLRYFLPPQFASTRPDARLELPVGTGLWVQRIDIRSP